MKYALTLLALLITSSCGLFATHYMGFTTTYEQRGGDTLRVHQYEYIDCNGVVPTGVWGTTITSVGGTCPVPTAGPTVVVSLMEVTPICPSMQTTCTNSSSLIYGLNEHHKYQDYDFGGLSCPEYILRYSNCCRSSSMVNINAPSSTSIVLETRITQQGYTLTNSSPEWRAQAPRFVYDAMGADHYYDLGATDPDGDSLVYSFVPAEMNGGPVTYSTGFSPTAPMGSDFTIDIDSQSGFMHIVSSPGANIVSAIVVSVEEYRGGVKLGEVRKEFQLATITFPAGAPTDPPTVTGIVGVTGGYQFGDTVVIPVGTTSCIDIQSDDIDLGDISRMRGYYFQDASPYYTAYPNNTPANEIFGEDPVMRFCISPLAEGIYEYYASAKDSTCSTVAMDLEKFYFVAGDTGKVWPGDANNDLVANNFDLLAIGLSFGSTGPARPGATTAWTGQPAIPWLDTISGGIDHKYQDSNGDGTVGVGDDLPIVLNYGLTHTKTNGINGGATDPLLQVLFPSDSFQVGDTVHVPILLGDSAIQAQNVYGIAFSINYDPSLVDSASFSIDFSNTWMGASPNDMSLSYDLWGMGQCDGAYVRTDHQVASGMGQIATASFVIIDNIDGKRASLLLDTLFLDISNVMMIGLDGEVIPVNAVGDEVIVFEALLDQGPGALDGALSVFPNPAKDIVRVRSESSLMVGLEVLDMQGRKIMERKGESLEFSLQTSGMPSGLYFIRIHTQSGEVTKKLLIE